MAQTTSTKDSQSGMTQLGAYSVSTRTLQVAQDVWDAVKDADWGMHDRISDWATAHGYRSERCDNYMDADSCHGQGAIIIDSWGSGIVVDGIGRNYSVDLDGDDGPLDTGDENGEINTVSFIYVND